MQKKYDTLLLATNLAVECFSSSWRCCTHGRKPQLPFSLFIYDDRPGLFVIAIEIIYGTEATKK